MPASPLINIGTIANDGTGDELRVAFRKINQKFNDIDYRLGDSFDVINSGIGEGIFVERIPDGDDNPNNNDVLLKSLIGGASISILPHPDPTVNSLVISAPDALTSTPIITDTGTYTLTTGNSLKILGGPGITTALTSNDEIVINNNRLSEVVEDTSPELGNDLDASGYNINNANSVIANDFIGGTFHGNLSGTIEGTDAAAVGGFFNHIDFGGFAVNASSFYEIFTRAYDVDFGTIEDPAFLKVDQGSI